jgi:dihydrofolate reductase
MALLLDITVSLDGFVAGPNPSLDEPLGRGGEQLHQWFVPTRTFQREVQRREGGTTGVDDDFAARSFENLGAWIMGRNMFGPVRGPWPDDEWKGWWGTNPPFHTPVFVLTHHVRPAMEMEGGTTFHFIDAPPGEALETARAAAKDQDVRLGGGATMIRDFVAAGLVDHMHIVVVPILLGRGVRLWDGLESLEKRYEIESISSPSGVTHMTFTRKGV